MSHGTALTSVAANSARARSARLRPTPTQCASNFKPRLDCVLCGGTKFWSWIIAILVLNIPPIVAFARAEPREPLPAKESYASQVIEFDIPAQSLELALNTYGAKTQIQLFVDAEMISGLRSGAVKGSFAPDTALAKLLSGTGLMVRAIGDQGFTLVPLSTLNHTGEPYPNQVSATVMRFTQYSGGIQNALRSVLCQRVETASGSYRALMRFWINASGTVTRSELISSTGDHTRDAVLSAAVRGVAMGSPPPAGLPQPVTLLVISDEMSSGYCSAGGASSREAQSGREFAR